VGKLGDSLRVDSNVDMSGFRAAVAEANGSEAVGFTDGAHKLMEAIVEAFNLAARQGPPAEKVAALRSAQTMVSSLRMLHRMADLKGVTLLGVDEIEARLKAMETLFRTFGWLEA
jgi:hypothetical protein